MIFAVFTAIRAAQTRLRSSAGIVAHKFRFSAMDFFSFPRLVRASISESPAQSYSPEATKIATEMKQNQLKMDLMGPDDPFHDVIDATDCD